MPLKTLSAQVSRLFSTKKNGGKLVYNPTDRLHNYKQFLLATSIVLLLGYSQFRDHFQCQGKEKLHTKHLTTWCWVNGTTTLNLKSDAGTRIHTPTERAVPHVGIQFAPAFKEQYEVRTHNYMRSLWALLLLMVLCSFIAKRKWASIFDNEILKALLKLPGHEELPLVKRAQELNAYDKLRELATKQRNNNPRVTTTLTSDGQLTGTDKKLCQLEALFHSIEIITGDQNEHNHTLDYYPNQLIYLLMAKRTSAYKLSGLKLRQKLVGYSICSFSLTVLQFLLPYFFIGPDYLNYGLLYAKAWLRYTLKLIVNPSYNVNSVDYEISSRIFPTATSCEYKEFGYQGQDRIVVQCTVPINEICGKLFALIWWLTVINIVVELYALISVLICSLNFATIRWSFGRKLSKRARKEAEVIATFRYQHALLYNKLLKSAAQGKVDQTNTNTPDHDDTGEQVAKDQEASANNNKTCEMSERDRKQLEAEGGERRNKTTSSQVSLEAKKWYLWCSRDVCLFLADKSKQIEPTKLMAKNRTPRDKDGFKELREDLNIYYLMYLLYLRLNCSRKKVEQIVRMTSDALGNYLENLKSVEDDIGDAIGMMSSAEAVGQVNYKSDLV